MSETGSRNGVLVGAQASGASRSAQAVPPAHEGPDPELRARPTSRRRFTSAYKLRILEEAEGCGPGSFFPSMICSVYTKRSSAKSSQRSFLPDVSAPIPAQSSATCRSFLSSAPPNGVPSPTSLPRRRSALWLNRTVLPLALQRTALKSV